MRIATLLGGALMLSVLGCGGGGGNAPTPAPPVVSLSADAAFEGRAFDIASGVLAERGLSLISSSTGGDAQISVTTASPVDESSATPFVARYWVAVAARRNPMTEVSMSELAAAERLVVPEDPAPSLDRWWPDAPPDAERAPLDDIPTLLEGDAAAVALLPLDAVDARVRSVAVEGIDPVFGAGDLASYPLVERAWVTVFGAEDEEVQSALDAAAAALAEGLGVERPRPITLRATGDIIPARCVYAQHLERGDPGHAFRELGPWLAEADITAGSLDASISDAGEPSGCVETFSLLAPADSVEGLSYAGYDVMTVATNHVKDCGQNVCGDEAFFDTLDNLRRAGIEPVGGGADLTEARRPAVLEVEGVRFAFLGYDEIASYYHAAPGVAGTAPLDEASLREDVAAAKARADVVVVLPQWGVEYTADPTAQQRALARAAVEAGADLVVGNHPHWVQAAEAIDGAFVAYALGNFVFDQDWSLETQQGVVLEAAFHGAELKGVRLHPIRIVDQHQPRFAGPDEARQILDRIWRASEALD